MAPNCLQHQRHATMLLHLVQNARTPMKRNRKMPSYAKVAKNSRRGKKQNAPTKEIERNEQ